MTIHPNLIAFQGIARRAKQAIDPIARLSSRGHANIPLYRTSDLSYRRDTLARDKGRIAIVTNRGPGSDGRDGVGRDRHCRAASAVSNRRLRERHDAGSVLA
ncbi:hypothetical protein RAD16_40120 [Bradyrhizobium sp. 18BD]